jgi:hypothetical protein
MGYSAHRITTHGLIPVAAEQEHGFENLVLLPD